MMFAEALAVLAGNISIRIIVKGAAAAAAIIGTAAVIGTTVCFVAHENSGNKNSEMSIHSEG